MTDDPSEVESKPTCPECGDVGRIRQASPGTPDNPEGDCDEWSCRACLIGREHIAEERLVRGYHGWSVARCTRLTEHTGEHSYSEWRSVTRGVGLCGAVECGVLLASLVQSEREWWLEGIYSTHVPDDHDVTERTRRADDRAAHFASLPASLSPF